MKQEFLVIHHTAVSREKNMLQYNATNDYHKSKGFPKSETGLYIGYHYFIEPSGKLYQTKLDHEFGAHCKEDEMNYKSLGICLTGNFDVEMPTEKQLATLATLITSLRIKYNISRQNVKFHRDYAPKTCPGNNFTRELLEKNMPMTELVRNKDTGAFYFIKGKSEGKQKITTVAGLLTVISREFGVRNMDSSTISKIPDNNYF